MDNLTHSLIGLALSRAGLKRLSAHSTALLVLSSNAPDVDIVAALRGALPYLEAHRGYTHSLVGLPVVAALSVLVVAGAFRRKLAFGRAFGLACIGVASHVLLDWTNSYGVRLLLPFSSTWFHSDLNSLYDWVIWGVLLFAAIWPLFAGLVSSEIGSRRSSGRGLACFALAFFLLFDIGRAVTHGRAIDQLQARLYDDAPPQRTAAFPDALNPLRWRAVVETQRTMSLLMTNVAGQLDLEEAEVFYKPSFDEAVLKAKETEPFRFFAYFSRFPVWSVQDVNTENGISKRIELSDLRFGSPGAGVFHCIAMVNNRGEVLLSLFTYGSGAEIGWGRDRPQLSQATNLGGRREGLSMRVDSVFDGIRVATAERDDYGNRAFESAEQYKLIAAP